MSGPSILETDSDTGEHLWSHGIGWREIGWYPEEADEDWPAGTVVNSPET